MTSTNLFTSDRNLLRPQNLHWIQQNLLWIENPLQKIVEAVTESSLDSKPAPKLVDTVVEGAPHMWSHS